MDDKQATALRAPFPANAVGKLPKPYKADSPKGNCTVCGGYHGLPAVHLDYVGHAATTDRLLQVDPNWSWEPMAVDEKGLPALDGARNLWIRLTIAGVTRIGVGDGKSMKECIGDAIRNAAMRFGVALDLWAKEDLHAVEDVTDEPQQPQEKTGTQVVRRKPRSVPDPPKDDPPAAPKAEPNRRGEMFACLAEIGRKDRDPALEYVRQVIGRSIVSRNELTDEEVELVIAEARAEKKRGAA